MYGMLEHMAYLNRTLEGPTLLQMYIKQVHGQDVFGSSSLCFLLLCRPLLDDVSVGCLGQGIVGLLRQCESFQRLLVLSVQWSNLFLVSNIPCWHREHTHPQQFLLVTVQHMVIQHLPPMGRRHWPGAATDFIPQGLLRSVSLSEVYSYSLSFAVHIFFLACVHMIGFIAWSFWVHLTPHSLNFNPTLFPFYYYRTGWYLVTHYCLLSWFLSVDSLLPSNRFYRIGYVSPLTHHVPTCSMMFDAYASLSTVAQTTVPMFACFSLMSITPNHI